LSVVLLPGTGAPSGPGSARARRPAWRRWIVVLAAVLAAGTVLAGFAVAREGSAAVTVRSPAGDLIARVPLTGDTFAVGYRNSVYGTRAEERYRLRPDGKFQLVGLAAEQAAVLEEYYAVRSAPQPAPEGDRMAYVAPPDPARAAVFDRLSIAATDLGERTLFVPGQPPVPIWQRVVTDDPTVLLDIEEN